MFCKRCFKTQSLALRSVFSNASSYLSLGGSYTSFYTFTEDQINYKTTRATCKKKKVKLNIIFNMIHFQHLLTRDILPMFKVPFSLTEEIARSYNQQKK